MKTKILCTIAFWSMLNMFATDFLINSDWNQKTPTGTPSNWELIGNPSNLKAENGILTLIEPSGSKTILLQSLKNINQGQTYELTYEVKAAVGSEYFVYLENKIDKSYGPATGKRFFGNGQWTKRCITFSIPEHSKNTRLVLRLMNACTVEFRNINIANSTAKESQAKVSVNYLDNTSFEDLNSKGLPLNWEILGEPETVSFNGDVASVTKVEDEISILSQSMKLTPKAPYCLTFEVNAPAGINCFVYIENKVGGVYQEANGKIFTGLGKWESRTIRFSPPNFVEKSRLIIRVITPGTVQFRNFLIQDGIEDHGLDDNIDYAVESKETLYNGNFENGESNWDMFFNSGVIRAFDNFGNYSMTLKNKGIAKQHAIRFLGGRQYRLTCFSKSTCGKTQKFRVGVAFPGSPIIEKEFIAVPESYLRNEFTFQAPSKDFNGTVICSLDDAESILLDEFFLDEISKEELLPLRLNITSPWNGSSIFSSAPVSEIAGEYTCNNDNVASVNIILEKDEKVFFKKENLPPKGTFSIPAKNLEFGAWRLTATPFDKAGNSLPSLTHKIKKHPPAQSEITYDNANNFYVNGKIFIPFVLLFTYDARNSDLSAYTARKNGINGVFSEEMTIKASLDKAYRNNMKRILSINHLTGLSKAQWQLPTKEFQPLFQKCLDEVMTSAVIKHPGLFAYDVFDEPWGNNIPLKNYQLACQMVREKDPYHPIIYTEAPRGVIPEYLAKFANYVDAIGTDLYPVPAENRHSSLMDKGLTGTGAYLNLLSNAVSGKKPLFIWLQAFNWKDIGSSRGRMPNAQETRFTIFDAMMNNASMLIFYNHNCFDTKYYQTILYPAIKEISKFAVIFRLGKNIENISVNAPIAVTAKTYEGNSYIILANRSNSPQSSVIRGISTEKSWHRLDCNSDVKITNGNFTAVLKPYDVHIYSTATKIPDGLDTPPAQNAKYETQQNDLFYPYFNQYPQLSGAYWIWHKGESMKNDSKITAVRDFMIREPIQQAILYLTADNLYTVFVNGKKAASSNRWNRILPIDVTKMLRNGQNQLSVTAENRGGWAGILAGLEIIYNNGTKETILSNALWRTKNEQGVEYNAENIKKIGEEPWSMNFEIIPQHE